MRSTAGATTGCEKSLVDHAIPISLNSTSSAHAGKVFESSLDAPLAKPRIKFFCMRANLAIKCEAAVRGLSLTKEIRWGVRAEMRLKAGGVRLARMRMYSRRTPRNF